MKKLFSMILILGLLLSGNALAKKPKKSPLLKLPKLLQYEHYIASEGNNVKMKKRKIKDNPVGEIVTFNSGDAAFLFNVLDGSYKNQEYTITGHLTFPKGEGKFPVLIYAHGSGGAKSFINRDDYLFYEETHKKLIDMGIAVFYIDNFSGRGVKDTWRDQSVATIFGQAVDAYEAFNFLKNHPKVNKNKIGITGHSRGGNVSMNVIDTKIRDVFLNKDEQFAASMPIATECRMFLYENPSPTKTKVLVVHGELDNYTLAKPCVEYTKKLKNSGGDVDTLIIQGAYHSFFGNWVVDYYKQIQHLNKCPFVVTTLDDGWLNDEFMNYVVDRVDDWKTIEDGKTAIKNNPGKAFMKAAKESIMHNKKGCASYGADEGGDWGWQGKNKPWKKKSESKIYNEFMFKYLNFWKETLLR